MILIKRILIKKKEVCSSSDDESFRSSSLEISDSEWSSQIGDERVGGVDCVDVAVDSKVYCGVLLRARLFHATTHHPPPGPLSVLIY